jgi:histidinol-phosphate aminotransferase
MQPDLKSGASMLALHRNQNCFGLSPSVRAILHTASDRAFSYPDVEVGRLQYTLARRFSLNLEQVVCAAGSSEVLRHALRQLARMTGMHLFCSSPCYSVVEATAGQYMSLTRVGLTRQMAVDLPALRLSVAQHPGPAAVYLSNPDCHTGELLDGTALADWIAEANERVFFIIDEAYLEFVPEVQTRSMCSLLKGKASNLLVLRTFSKAYGLAGLRVGYGLVSSRWTTEFSNCGVADTLNLLGARAALDSLENAEWLAHSLLLLQVSRSILLEGLAEMGIPSHAGPVNFVLHACTLNEAQRHCLREVYGLRIVSQIEGLPGWCRVTVGSVAEVTYYLNALRILMSV